MITQGKVDASNDGVIVHNWFAWDVALNQVILVKLYTNTNYFDIQVVVKFYSDIFCEYVNSNFYALLKWAHIFTFFKNIFNSCFLLPQCIQMQGH